MTKDELSPKEGEVIITEDGVDKIVKEEDYKLQENEIIVTRGGHKRVVKDRRKKPTPFISKYTFWGKRRGNRRDSDPQKNYYVDRVGAIYWIVVFIIIILSVSDSIFTLHHLKFGYKEINPVLNKFLFSNAYFLLIKYAFTVVGILALVLHKFFIFVRELIIFIILSYAALNIYQIWLFVNLPQ
ncbi:MAG: DUF5658 family protein [Pseudomonadota bacterium]